MRQRGEIKNPKGDFMMRGQGGYGAARRAQAGYRAIAIATLGMAAGLSAAPVAAQSSGDDAQLSEIVVTAERRETRLQATPIAVTALSGAAMAERGATTVSDLAGTIPNFTGQASPAGGDSSGQYFIRGVGQFDFIVTQEPSVGLYLDGVYVGRTAGAALDLVNIERVEVLRGPQGTLFGRNTTGGAIQVVTQKPAREFGGSAEVTFGSRKRLDIRASINAPLIEDRLFANVAVASFDQEGYGRRLTTGEKVGERDNIAGRAQLFYDGDDVDIRFAVDGSKRDVGPGQESLILVDLANPASAGVVAYNASLQAMGFAPIGTNFIPKDPLDTYSAYPAKDNYEIYGGNLTVDWSIGPDLSLKSISAYRNLKAQASRDFDSTPYPLIQQAIDDDQSQISQELQLAGKAFDQRLQYVAGLFYYRERARQSQFADLFVPIVRTGPGAYDFAPTAGGTALRVFNNQTTKSYAAFAQLDYRLTDSFSLTAGLRYSRDEKDLISSFGVGVFGNVRPPAKVTDSWSNLSPKVGVQYKPNDDVMLYASLSRGFRSGGFNGRSFVPAPPTSFGNETIWAYEAGLKSEWLGRRLRFNLAGFYYDYKDYQGSTLDNLAVVVGNIANVALSGFEIESAALLFPGFRLEANLGYLHQNIKKVDPNAAVSIAPFTKLVNSPKWSGSLGAQYEADLGGKGTLTVRGDASYRSTIWFFLPNSPGENQKSYWLYNGRIGYREPGDKWEIQFYGLNLANKRYKVFAENEVGFGTAVTFAQYGRPREFGLTVKARL